MTQHVAAIERRYWDEVENTQDDIDDHELVEQQAGWYESGIRLKGDKSLWNAVNDLLAGWRRVFDDFEQNHGRDGYYEIAHRPYDGSEYIVEHRILEIARVHRRRFGPTDHRKVGK